MFAYCKNNVVNGKDPSGFRPVYTEGEETDEMRKQSYRVMNKATSKVKIRTYPGEGKIIGKIPGPPMPGESNYRDTSGNTSAPAIKSIKKGTYGVGGSASISNGWRGSVSIQLVVDKEWNMGILFSSGVGAGSPAPLSFGLCGTYTNGETIDNLEGPGLAGGGSASGGLIPFGVGGDYVWSSSCDGCSYNIGVKAQPFTEAHGEVNNSFFIIRH